MTLSAHEVRRIAVDARVAPKTVKKLLAGESVTQLSELRIRESLRRLGFQQEDVHASNGANRNRNA